MLRELMRLPDILARLVERREEIRLIAQRFTEATDFIFLGRNVHFPMALEGALKLKEISYIHAEGYAAGEMKHGPIALVRSGLPVLAIAPRGPSYEKMAANIAEVRAREGAVIAIATEGDEEIERLAPDVIRIPEVAAWLQPALVAVPLQILAYHLGVLRGCDVDQPRNLAKSVTVE